MHSTPFSFLLRDTCQQQNQAKKKLPLLPKLEKAVLDTPDPTRNFFVMPSIENIDQPLRDAIRKQSRKMVNPLNADAQNVMSLF